MTEVSITLAFGSNLPSKYGSPEENIRQAVVELAKYGIKITKMSQIIDSEPVGLLSSNTHTPQAFKNAVAYALTSLTPRELLQVIHAIEADFGRMRNSDSSIKLNREIDIDIIEYGEFTLKSNEVYQTADLTIPHPKAGEREFVVGLLEV